MSLDREKDWTTQLIGEIPDVSVGEKEIGSERGVMNSRLKEVTESGPMMNRLMEWLRNYPNLYPGVLYGLKLIAKATDKGERLPKNQVHYHCIFPDEVLNIRDYLENILLGSDLRLACVANKYSFKDAEPDADLARAPMYPLRPMCSPILNDGRDRLLFVDSGLLDSDLFLVLSYLAQSTDNGLRCKSQDLKEIYSLKLGWEAELATLAQQFGFNLRVRARYHLSLDVDPDSVRDLNEEELAIEDDPLYADLF